MLFRKVLSLIISSILSAACAIPALAADMQGYTLQATFENDAFCGDDRYYTTGFQMRLTTPKLYDFSIGQRIYTPDATQVSVPPSNDRPYAGYLYGTFAVHFPNGPVMDTWELTAGVIGKSARGKQVQNGFHHLIGARKSNGWSQQLGDEPAVMLTYSRAFRLNPSADRRGFAWDILPFFSVSLGTPVTQAGAGAEFRFGWNLPNDFGSHAVRPGSGVRVPSKSASEQREVCLYAFAGGGIKGVLWNSFLDGNLWQDSRSVHKYPCVGEFNAGLVWEYGRLRIAYTHVLRGKEFHGQHGTQRYGSITVGWVF